MVQQSSSSDSSGAAAVERGPGDQKDRGAESPRENPCESLGRGKSGLGDQSQS